MTKNLAVFSNSKDVHFSVDRDGEKLKGFSLKGVENTEAEAYCVSFISAQCRGRGKITFEEGKIVFCHEGIGLEESNKEYGIYGISNGGIFSADISDEDAKELSQLLERQGEYENSKIHVCVNIAWGRGFTLYTVEPE
jgi:hypothetical protein